MNMFEIEDGGAELEAYDRLGNKIAIASRDKSIEELALEAAAHLDDPDVPHVRTPRTIGSMSRATGSKHMVAGPLSAAIGDSITPGATVEEKDKPGAEIGTAQDTDPTSGKVKVKKPSGEIIEVDPAAIQEKKTTADLVRIEASILTPEDEMDMKFDITKCLAFLKSAGQDYSITADYLNLDYGKPLLELWDSLTEAAVEAGLEPESLATTRPVKAGTGKIMVVTKECWGDRYTKGKTLEECQYMGQEKLEVGDEVEFVDQAGRRIEVETGEHPHETVFVDKDCLRDWSEVKDASKSVVKRSSEGKVGTLKVYSGEVGDYFRLRVDCPIDFDGEEYTAYSSVLDESFSGKTKRLFLEDVKSFCDSGEPPCSFEIEWFTTASRRTADEPKVQKDEQNAPKVDEPEKKDQKAEVAAEPEGQKKEPSEEYSELFAKYLEDLLTDPEVAQLVVKKLVEKGRIHPELMVKLTSGLNPRPASTSYSALFGSKKA